MKNRRPWKDVEIEDMEHFGRQWWAWWISLQPNSRICNKDTYDTSLPSLEMDWTLLKKPGKNGMLLIMLALVWWGKAVDRDNGWLKAVADVTVVLPCILGVSSMASGVVNKAAKQGPLSGSGVANTKRSRGESEAGHSKKKRRT